MPEPINTLFLDIGGVLLTNGWDRIARKLAAKEFCLDVDEMNERHHLTFDTYESGKLSLEEYLYRVVFYKTRSFTSEQFIEFIYEQSQQFPKMVNLIRDLKTKYRLKIAVVSNEGRDDRSLFVQVAKSLGIKGIHHTDYESTCKKLNKYGLRL